MAHPVSLSEPVVAVALRSGRETTATAPTVAPVVYLASHVPLRVFAGHPDDDVTAWADIARRALAAAGLDSDDAAVQRRAAAALESALSGAAADAVAVLPDKDRANPATILATVVKAFGVVHPAATARARLYGYRRTNETVNAFAATLARRCHDVDPKMGEDEKVSHFLRALDDATARHLLRAGIPESVDAAVAAARNAEHAAHLGHPDIVLPTAAPIYRPQTHDDDLRAAVQHLIARLAVLEANPPIVAAAAPRPFAPPRPRPNLAAAPRRDPSRDRWAADGTILCNLCGQPGHKAIQCASHPRNRPQQPPAPPGPAATVGGRRPQPHFL
jgi:hypothetical protein